MRSELEAGSSTEAGTCNSRMESASKPPFGSTRHRSVAAMRPPPPVSASRDARTGLDRAKRGRDSRRPDESPSVGGEKPMKRPTIRLAPSPPPPPPARPAQGARHEHSDAGRHPRAGAASRTRLVCRGGGGAERVPGRRAHRRRDHHLHRRLRQLGRHPRQSGEPRHQQCDGQRSGRRGQSQRLRRCRASHDGRKHRHHGDCRPRPVCPARRGDRRRRHSRPHEWRLHRDEGCERLRHPG